MDARFSAMLAGIIPPLATSLEVAAKTHAPGALVNLPPGQVLNLWQQLLGDSQTPTGLTLQFLGLHTLDLPSLLQPDPDPFVRLRDVFARPVQVIKQLFAAKNPAEALATSEALVREDWHNFLRDVAPLIGAQFGILLSLLTTWANLPTQQTVEAVRQALLEYFFTRAGYRTVDGTQLVAPVHLTDLDLHNTGQFKAVFSERTAERYVRDLIRVFIEAADNVRYNQLDRRYQALLSFVPPEKQTKFVDWFRGMASAAESSVMDVVEEVVLGVSEFQT